MKCWTTHGESWNTALTLYELPKVLLLKHTDISYCITNFIHVITIYRNNHVLNYKSFIAIKVCNQGKIMKPPYIYCIHLSFYGIYYAITALFSSTVKTIAYYLPLL